ncbi:CLUMA_CG013638, isoform A [Clunio marinus]|uniref:Phosphodiesterase n=1 Tax=Clunio marinus TaxID=568069 RepID=A0A1J1IKS7_9DIPT|nr:CLUMA_CG013638, isoform A [Clunio marinus]
MEFLRLMMERAVAFWRNRRFFKFRSTNDNHNRNSTDEKDPKPKEFAEEEIHAYLKSHPEYIESYIMDEVELELLERWMIRRTQKAKKLNYANRKTSLSRWKFCVHADKRQMLEQLTQQLQMKPTKTHVLFELSSCISNAVNADGFRLYLVEEGTDILTVVMDSESFDDEGDPRIMKIVDDASIASYVASTREPVRFSRGDCDCRFPNGITDKDTQHILCQAVVYPDGSLVAVLECWRRRNGPKFHEEDEEIGYSYLVWGGIALHYMSIYINLNKQKKLNDFLLAVVKSIFQDMVSMDMLVIKIMNYAQRLVNADRASLFLIDSKTNELYATIFDVGFDDEIQNKMNSPRGAKETTEKLKSDEIRFPVGTGIAGLCALSGEIFNIVDAYSDTRFNRNIDQITGYKTDTILCMPIFIRGSLIGVVEMVNKRVGFFTKEDEEAFETFAIYCGLALHHAKLYDKIRRSEKKYRVALEVLSYHNACSETELEKIEKMGIPATLTKLADYSFSPFDVDEYQKVTHVIFMFKDMFSFNRFDQKSLIRFVLTVKKNYRRVPYHNWSHGFSVSNSMYAIIKNSKTVFRPNECLALFIGSLCHDLDHRGKSNKFMLDSASPIAAIYSTSTMEHHHFNQTVTILQQEGHNILGKLSSTEYKQILSLIKHCILATDLALFFPNKAKLCNLVDEEKFSWSILEHRLMVNAMAMTAADLSASAKPWEVQAETVKGIFEEFYDQGDAEREAGRVPMPMMDRNQPDQQASSQLGFLNGICIPCYSLLNRLIPETKPMLKQCQENLIRWQGIENDMKKKKESTE